MTARRAPVLVVTQGDPAGIGVEIALKSWSRRAAGVAPFFLLADPSLVARTLATLGWAVPSRECAPEEAAEIFATALPIVPLSQPSFGGPGAPDPRDAASTVEAIRTGVGLVRSGAASAIVTTPISKANLYRAGFDHPGHTEFLGELAERLYDRPARPTMMLWAPELAVVPVTIHVALEYVFKLLTTDAIAATARVVAADLRTRFGVAHPRLAVSGLNPHAGEGGAMGRQEIETIAPAIALLRQEGFDVSGPWAADSMFSESARSTYDVALCMYHDQALIPIKTLAFDRAVNVTLGLPFVRTSPDHGTAYDIAGRGIARSESLEAAIALAARLASATA